MKNKGLALNALGVAGFLVLWQVVSAVASQPAIPDMGRIVRAFYEIFKGDEIYVNIFTSLKLVLIGVAFAFCLGTVVGTMCEKSEVVNGLLSPIIEGARSVAAISLFPLLIVLFGIGDLPRIIVIFWTAFPATILCTMQGLRSVDESLIEAGYNMGCSDYQLYKLIKIPLALPEILNGLRISLGNGFIAIVVAEMLGASKGLGFMVQWTTQSFNYAHTYAYIFIIAIVGGSINYIMNQIIKAQERKLFV